MMSSFPPSLPLSFTLSLRRALCLILLAVSAQLSRGQSYERWPPVVPPESPFSRYTPAQPMERPGRLTAYADPNIQQSSPQNEPEAQPPVVPQLPPGAKPGVLQRVKFINTWLSGRDGDDLSFFD